MRKIVAGMMAVGLVALGGCSGDADSEKTAREFTAEEQTLIEENQISAVELAAADCQAGNACWVAVDGVVYDASDVTGWGSGGNHHNNAPGQDLTDVFLKESPHGAAYLMRMDVVGGYAG